MKGRVLSAGVLTVGLVVGTAPSAAAQDSPVGGVGHVYFIAGAGNPSGQAARWFLYGEVHDEVYVGDFFNATASTAPGDGRDEPMVQRGNWFVVRGMDPAGFYYGDPGDTVLVGDWDGDGRDTLAVRRGNDFYVKNTLGAGVADHVFTFGDPGDTVLVGNWDAGENGPAQWSPVTTDTLMVQRGNRLYVKNDLETGVADYEFSFGDPGDTILVGDWATPPVLGDDPTTPQRDTNFAVQRGTRADGADQLAVRRGNVYHQSDELWKVEETGADPGTLRALVYGDQGDTAFVAAEEYTYATSTGFHTVLGDGLAVRRPWQASDANRLPPRG